MTEPPEPTSSAASEPPEAGDGFPYPGATCEQCGYPLTGLSLGGDCPECGRPIEQSSPSRRPGLDWQQHPGVRSFFRTSLQIATSPRAAFNVMRVGGGNGRDRLFLFLFAASAGLLWTLVWTVARLPQPALWGIAAALAIIAMTYVEVLGVLYAGRHRGWRASWGISERVCCYCGVGWFPAALIGVKVAMLDQMQLLAGWWPALLGDWTNWHRFFILVLLACIGMLGFETLVWIGIERTRFANAPRQPGNGRAHR